MKGFVRPSGPGADFILASLIDLSGKLAIHVLNSNVAIHSFLTLQMSLRTVALFEKIYDVEPILTLFSNIGEETMPLFQLKL
jgi:hypothetical protein